MKISIKQYAQALYELTLGKSESEINVVIEKFVKELAKNNQIKLSTKILDKFEQMYNKENGIIEAQVTSAFKLEGVEIEKLKAYLLEKYSAKEIIFNNKIDENIKGGVIIKVGDELIDASIAGKLRSLKESLVN
jgi:F-type H+-transporting ATPase subunit delta